jgi:hypothetical protein
MARLATIAAIIAWMCMANVACQTFQQVEKEIFDNAAAACDGQTTNAPTEIPPP